MTNKTNNQTGKELMTKYLGNNPKLAKRLEHSQGVGDFAYKIAQKVSSRNPELGLDSELIAFLGYSHDIGYSIADGKHEVHTVNLLEKEGYEHAIARKAMHGQLVEQFSENEGNVKKYLPRGIEGMILTYADMSVRTGEPVSIKERASEIIGRIKSIPTMSEQLKTEIETNMYKALPRFERYEKVVLALTGVNSVKEIK